MSITSLTLICFSALCTVLTQMLLKGVGSGVSKVITSFSLRNVYQLLLYCLTTPNILFAVLVQGIGFIIWIVVISREGAATALAVGGAGVYILTAIAENYLYGVRISTIHWLALAFVTLGAVLLSSTD